MFCLRTPPRLRWCAAVALGCMWILPRSAGATTTPLAETAAMVRTGNEVDVADGVCVWVHPTDGARSVILGANKDEGSAGGIYAFAPDGSALAQPTWQAGVNWFDAGQKINVADLRYGFPAGGQNWDILCGANRTTDSIDIFRVETGVGGDFAGLTQVGAVQPTNLTGDYPYGLAMFHARREDRYYVVTSDKSGLAEQFELSYDADAAAVVGTSVWHGDVSDGAGEVEGIVADDEKEVVYIAAENTHLFRYPTVAGVIQNAATLVDSVGGPTIPDDDIEGLALYTAPDGEGYLIASSQGEDEFVVYERGFSGGGANAYVLTFEIGDGDGIDAVQDTDGIYVVNADLGGDFDDGMFVAHDGQGDSPTTFKFVDWADVADEPGGPLIVDTSWDPHNVRGPSGVRWRGLTESWSEADNWSINVPHARNVVTFDGAAAGRTADLEAATVAAHRLRFTDGNSGYEIRNGTVALGAVEGLPPAIEQLAGVVGTNVISASIDAAGLEVHVGGGVLELSGFSDANGVQIDGELVLGGGHSVCRLLELGPAGRLDVGAASLTVVEGVLADVLAEIAEARNGGAWDGATGITSSAAADANAVGLAVGAVDGIDGVFVSAGLKADTNLDGEVDFDDYVRTRDGFAAGGAVWETGDSDYDGAVTHLDYLALKRNFGRFHPAAQPGQAPEPGLSLILPVAAAWLLTRRGRRVTSGSARTCRRGSV